jgi:hypothetical protein
MKQNCYPSKATMLSEIHSLLAPPDAFEVAVCNDFVSFMEVNALTSQAIGSCGKAAAAPR